MDWQFSKRGRERLAVFATLVAAAAAIPTDTNAAETIATVANAGHADFASGAAVVASPLTATTVVESVYPGNMQRIYRQVSYNGATCKEITPGTWTINQAPLHGTVSVGTVDLPLTGGLCPGVIFTWAAIFYKWTSTIPTDLTDVVAATWTNAVPQSFSYVFDLNLSHLQIDLVSPPANSQYPITAMPSMPVVQAKAKVVNVTPDPTATTVFTWTASLIVQDGASQPHDYSAYLSQSVTTTGPAVYSLSTVPSTTFAGGALALKVTATVNGFALTGSTTTAPTIVGTNPQRSAIHSYIAATVPTLALDGLKASDVTDVTERITCQESNQRQFNAAADGGIGPVLFAPDNGVGISQLTIPSPFADPNLLFNWQTNAKGGLSLFSQKIPTAQGYPARLTSDPKYTAAITKVNQTRVTNGLAPITSNPAPAFTTTGLIGSTPSNQLLDDTTRGYNGYGGTSPYVGGLHEFQPDLKYLSTVPNAALPGLNTNPLVWMRVLATARGPFGDPNYVAHVTSQSPQCGN